MVLFCIFWQGKASQIYTFPDLCGSKFTFHPNEGHVYGSNKKCADSNFSLSKPTCNYCDARPGENCHDHDKVSRDLVEYETICWGCLLRIINGRGEETLVQSVESVVMSWPHELSIPNLINSITGRLSGSYGVLSRHSGVRSKKKFLSDFGDDKYQEFRQFLLSFRPNYWSDPVLVSTEGNPC